MKLPPHLYEEIMRIPGGKYRRSGTEMLQRVVAGKKRAKTTRQQGKIMHTILDEIMPSARKKGVA